MDINKTKFLSSNKYLEKLDFSGLINDDPQIISTVNPLYLSFKASTKEGNLIEFTIYGEAQGDLISGFGFAEMELNKDELAPLYLLSRFSIIGSAIKGRISFVGVGDLRNIYELVGSITFNVILEAQNSIIDKQSTKIEGFLQYEKPHNTIAPVTIKRLPNSLYNKNSMETNINRLLRSYDKELLRVKSRIKMIQMDSAIDLARHISLINNFSYLLPGISPRLFDPEEYRKVLKKVNDILLLEDGEDMIREAIRFFTDAEPEIIDLSKYKFQLGSTRLSENSHIVDRDIFAFTCKAIVKNPHRKKINKKAITAFLQFFIPAHIKLILQFEDGELVNI